MSRTTHPTGGRSTDTDPRDVDDQTQWSPQWREYRRSEGNSTRRVPRNGPSVERGVAPLVGFVLLFGAIVILMGVYQATVVPAENFEVEFDHNDRVQSDFQQIRAAVVSTAVTGDVETVPVALGTNYPSRSLFINPPPPTGTVETTGTTSSTSRIAIVNAEADGDAGDYWDGQPREFSTGTLRYRPGYNEYQDAPVTVYENSVLFNRFNETTDTIADQMVIEDQRIRLVAVNGSLSETRDATYSVSVRSVSASSTAVILHDTGDNIRIEIPTTLPKAEWDAILDGEFVANGTGGHITDTSMTTLTGSEFDLLTIELEAGIQYELHLAKAGVGTGVTQVEVGYVRRVSGDNATMPLDGEEKLTAQVRDRFNNPQRGETVLFTTRNGTFADGSTSRSVRSDTEGETSVRFSPDNAGDATIQAGIDTTRNGDLDDEPAALTTSFQVEVRGGDG